MSEPMRRIKIEGEQSEVPAGLPWIAQDADGPWYAYDVEPLDPHPKDPGRWNTEPCELAYFITATPPNLDWRQTKRYIGNDPVEGL